MEGHFEYKYDEFWKDYGVVYTETDSEDKKALYAMMCEAFNLEVHEKRIILPIVLVCLQYPVQLSP